MNKITKEMCFVFLKDYYKSKVISLSFISLFLLIAMWIFTKKIIIIAFITILLLGLCIVCGIKVKNRIKNVCLIDFYLVEDIVIDFKKHFILGKIIGYEYNYKFKKYGMYSIRKSICPIFEIPLHREKHISHLTVDKLSSQSCNTGDVFYLLISKEKKQEKIIKCFYKYCFDIIKEDFDYADGKYYCKNDIN